MSLVDRWGDGVNPLDGRKPAEDWSSDSSRAEPLSPRRIALSVVIALAVVVTLALVALANLETWLIDDELSQEQQIAREVGLAEGVTPLGEGQGGGADTSWEIYVAVPTTMAPSDGLELPDFVTRYPALVDFPGLVGEGRRGDCYLTISELAPEHYLEVRGSAPESNDLDPAPAGTVVLQILGDCLYA